MTFYVVYRAPRNNKNRGVIPNELRSLGCTSVHKSLWEVKEDKVKKVLQILHECEPIILKRTREFRKTRWNRKGKITDIGSLSIIAYNIPNGKRKLVNRTLAITPCIRLCRAVYAFPQGNNAFGKNQIDALLNLIQKNHGDTRFIPRMIIEDTDSIQHVVDEIEESINQETAEVIALSEKLAIQIKENGNSPTKSTEKLANLRQRYLTFKKVANEYEKWLKLDFSKNTLKTYRAIKKTRDILEQN
jgi:hypothetical protein